MKKIIKTLFVCLLFIGCINTKIFGESYKNGYSEWSPVKSNDANEVSTIQYGRKKPKKWSNWSIYKSDSLHQRSRIGKTNHYAYDGEIHFWDDAKAKTLFTIDFGVTSRVSYLYIDVDTYVSNGYTNYQGPPMQVYCDNRLIASTGVHDVLVNWNPSIDCNCRLLKVNMSSNNTSGRDTTTIVGTWATTTQTEYSHVIEWDDGSDWRFDKPYETKYGEESQIPTTRTVYSHPIKYKISYDLDGGTTLGDLKYEYTVLEEVNFPEVYKKGYDFLGFYEGNAKVSYIPKGTYRDYRLKAKYKRKSPTIYVLNNYFNAQDRTMSIGDVLRYLGPVAKDELDGDISSKIRIDTIYYFDDKRKDDNPKGLDLHKGQEIRISFSVINSGNQKTTIIKNFYILAEHSSKDITENDVKIYSRFINEEYADTLESDSIWNSESYSDLLAIVYEKMRKED